MSQLVLTAKETLKSKIFAALQLGFDSGQFPINAEKKDFTVEVPAERENGNFSSNAALVHAKAFGMSPHKIAEFLQQNIDLSGTVFPKCEIAGPGFLNFFFSEKFFPAVLQEIFEKGKKYGCSSVGGGEKVMVEFVSANPTGPMHMGNARGGALGDCLAAVLQATGHDVTREFYINDTGNQIDKFGMSLGVRYMQLFDGESAHELPEDAYHGADITELAQRFAKIHGDKFVKKDTAEREKALIEFGLPENIECMKRDLAKYRIEFDVWFSERSLHESGEITETIELLTARGHTYEKDGALWYKATSFGEEKDEVLVRSNGVPTYFAADIAYHRNKFEKRGFTRCIDIWGADHHGHVARMKKSMDAIGLDGNKLDVVLMQLVKLVKNGEVMRMSKRSGKAVGLSQLLDAVPVDAARFIFNMREANSQMEFDLDLAVKEDMQNPVYYVQYAYARLCSVLRKARGCGQFFDENADFSLLQTPEEKELILHLAGYTSELVSAALHYDPPRIIRYVIQLAALFHKFYVACRVCTEDKTLTSARLALCSATQIVLRNALTMFKISAPDRM